MDLEADVKGLAPYATAFLAGVGLQQLLFRFGEWDDWSLQILGLFAVAPLGLGLFFHQQQGDALYTAINHGLCLVLSAISGVWTSMLIYRAFFHRLGRFPGPFPARLATLYMTHASMQDLPIYKYVQALHARYGDIVRVGPTELSIADPEAFSAIYSGTSPCTRGPWYNMLKPAISLQMERDNKKHSQRRKAWDRAFSVQALRDYQGRVNSYTDHLLMIIDESTTKSKGLNLSKWFKFYTFDVMGDLAFGRSFGMLEDGIEHYFFTSTQNNMRQVGRMSRILWLTHIYKSTPILNAKFKRFQRWLRGTVEKRIANSPAVPDIFHWILADYDSNPSPKWQDKLNLYGDGGLIVVAGSDTTAVSLVCLFYNLVQNPETYKKLQKEIDNFMPAIGDGPLENHGLVGLKYLQACIDESLRLFPPVPSGLQRQTPPEGLRIGDDGTWIPGNTIVQMPFYTLYRDSRVFAEPDEFVPERWTTRTELVKDASVYAPFSGGRFNCVGKQLALMEMRRVTALIAHRYDVSFAPEQDPAVFENKMRDCFTLCAPDFNFVFTPRK